jgi:hypothetical protein
MLTLDAGFTLDTMVEAWLPGGETWLRCAIEVWPPGGFWSTWTGMLVQSFSLFSLFDVHSK